MWRPRAPELTLSIMSILLPGLAVRVRITALTLALLAAAACRESRPPEAFPTVVVEASGETEPVATADADAADDPAIWRNPADPEASWIVGTDKKAGVHVYGLDGRSRFFLADGRLNNVDLVDGGGMGVIVVASDRNDPGAAVLRIYRLETRAPALIPLGTVAGGVGEAYGLALWLGPEGLHAYSVLKSGAIEEVLIDLSGGSPVGRTLRRMQLASQAEGCVVDPRDGTLYVAEEAVGIWRFGRGVMTGTLVAAVDGRFLAADVEGLALVTDGVEGGVLVASSQGDNAFAVFALPWVSPVGRFRVGVGAYGAVEETDGIEVRDGTFGPRFPGGLLVVQDGVNGARAQNFKLVDWGRVRRALGAGVTTAR